VSTVLVDSNVLLDIFTEDPHWYDWSAESLVRCAEESSLAINPIIYGEVSLRFRTIEELEDVFPSESFQRLPLPWEAAFLAGRCFLKYRSRGGHRRSRLPDFYIGAHAAVDGMLLLTRDPRRYSRILSKAEPRGAPKGEGPTSMKRQYSISDAGKKLPSLVRDAEKGEAISLTRRGEPVAVLLSIEKYIDGRPVTWEAFGRMLLRYEGWQFKLEIYDLSEEIGDDSLDRPRFLMSRAENKRLN
jgi:prevent-host-death family protein